MTEPTFPSRLWKRMTTAQRLRAAQALWANEEAAADQKQAVQLIAKQFKLRPKTANGLDVERKARYLAGVPEVPEEMAAHLLIVYHLADQRPLMGAFLDALGIAHDNGMIDGDAPAPDPSKVTGAVDAIKSRFPAEDVALYLDTLLLQDPGTWGGLQEVR
jgi:hypothetical protein